MSQPMQPISRWSDIPAFDDEEAEAKFWESHELDARLMSGSIHEPDSRESTTITLRFDPRAERFPDDREANALVRREYRAGHWAVPQGV